MSVGERRKFDHAYLTRVYSPLFVSSLHLLYDASLRQAVHIPSIEQDTANFLHQQIFVCVDVQHILDNVEPLGSECIENE